MQINVNTDPLARSLALYRLVLLSNSSHLPTLIGGDVAILLLPQLTAHALVDQKLLHTYSNKVCHLQEKNYLEFTNSNVEVLGVTIL